MRRERRWLPSTSRSPPAPTSHRCLEGLPGDHCDAPHWGYVFEGVVVVTYADGTEETVVTGDLFYWPPGHSVRVADDAEIVLFSPTHAHRTVIDHMRNKMGLPA